MLKSIFKFARPTILPGTWVRRLGKFPASGAHPGKSQFDDFSPLTGGAGKALQDFGSDKSCLFFGNNAGFEACLNPGILERE
jgi:hypothetical protein